jgi:hypothetical protein
MKIEMSFYKQLDEIMELTKIHFKKFSERIPYKSMNSNLINILLSHYFLGISEVSNMKTMSQSIALFKFSLTSFKNFIKSVSQHEQKEP